MRSSIKATLSPFVSSSSYLLLIYSYPPFSLTNSTFTPVTSDLGRQSLFHSVVVDLCIWIHFIRHHVC